MKCFLHLNFRTFKMADKLEYKLFNRFLNLSHFHSCQPNFHNYRTSKLRCRLSYSFYRNNCLFCSSSCIYATRISATFLGAGTWDIRCCSSFPFFNIHPLPIGDGKSSKALCAFIQMYTWKATLLRCKIRASWVGGSFSPDKFLLLQNNLYRR